MMKVYFIHTKRKYVSQTGSGHKEQVTLQMRKDKYYMT